MDQKPSPWISCFDDTVEDPFHLFKDGVSLDLETHINKVANQIFDKHPGSSRKNTQSLAINLIMERLLVLQREYSPVSQTSMVYHLFSTMPELADIRNEVIQKAQERVSIRYKIKQFFKKP